MPVPHYQRSSGAIIYTLTPLEKEIIEERERVKNELEESKAKNNKLEHVLTAVLGKLGYTEEEVQEMLGDNNDL